MVHLARGTKQVLCGKIYEVVVTSQDLCLYVTGNQWSYGVVPQQALFREDNTTALANVAAPTRVGRSWELHDSLGNGSP